MRIAKCTFIAGGLVALAAALLLASGIVRADEPTEPDTPAIDFADESATETFDKVGTLEESPQESAEETPVASSEKAPAPQKFAGRGRQASQKFTLAKGLAIFRTTYKGDANYIVGLVNGDGEEVQNLFNQIGPYEGGRGFEIKEAGEYLLNVQAGGDWTFAIEQPRPAKGQATPTAIKGNRTDVSPFLTLKKGLSVFKLSFKGDGRFAATLTDQNGRPVEYLVNTLRTFQGSVPVKVPAEGIYFINVSAEGDWQIDIQ